MTFLGPCHCADRQGCTARSSGVCTVSNPLPWSPLCAIWGQVPLSIVYVIWLLWLMGREGRGRKAGRQQPSSLQLEALGASTPGPLLPGAAAICTSSFSFALCKALSQHLTTLIHGSSLKRKGKGIMDMEMEGKLGRRATQVPYREARS